MNKYSYILEFPHITEDDITQVGSIGLNIGTMYRNGFPVPEGFIVPNASYKQFLKENDLEDRIRVLLKSSNLKDTKELHAVSEKIRSLMSKSKIPDDIQSEIRDKYHKMGSLFTKSTVAVRSSATSSNSPKVSFVGQQESFLNIQGDSNVLEMVRRCWSSLFTASAIFYREEKEIDHFKVGLAVIIQEMVQSEVSGVAFTMDITNQDKTKIVIEAIWGLGELFVQGNVTPDRYEVDRHNLQIVNIQKNFQKTELVKKSGKSVEKRVPSHRTNKQKLSEEKIIKLAKILQKIHAYYFFPQDIEWAFKGDQFYILQTRPITNIENPIKSGTVTIEKESSDSKLHKPILEGLSVRAGIVTGQVRIVKDVKSLSKVKKDNILVASTISPDYIPVMKNASAIITDHGGITSHASIVARELGIPCVVGTQNATKVLKDGDIVTVNAKTGKIYKGKIVQDIVSDPLPKKENPIITSKVKELKTATKIFLNLADPEKSESLSSLPVDGIGLVRAEFMIAQIGDHPKHMVAQGRQEKFVRLLADGIEEICRNFDPRSVIYRTSDLKTNEYRKLNGGKAYEPEEENPMLGFRGALRYIHDPEIFELELAAIKRVREKYKNLWVMIPYVRSPEELLQVKRIMAASGLMRSESFKLWMMVETPANVIQIEDFIKVGIDGISIGSNDLTMLITGSDRDSEDVSTAYNPLSPAVLWSMERVIRAAKKHKIKSCICGQAASTSDILVEELVRMGITSVSINPDSFVRVRNTISETERKLIK